MNIFLLLFFNDLNYSHNNIRRLPPVKSLALSCFVPRNDGIVRFVISRRYDEAT